MKTGWIALLALAVAVPALAEEVDKKSYDGVEFECTIGGSGMDGWSITGKPLPQTKVKKTCSATCTLTDKNGKTETVKADNRPVFGDRQWKQQLAASQSALKNAPYKSPRLTGGSCREG